MSHTDQSLLDDLADLLEESLQPAANALDELADLDVLLAESTKLAGARKAKATGRKLTTEQNDLLEANQLAEELQTWQPVEVFAHVVKTVCACGNRFDDFRGWYRFDQQRRGSGRRLIRVPAKGDVPAKQYITETVVPHCHACAPVGLQVVGKGYLDLLANLGG